VKLARPRVPANPRFQSLGRQHVTGETGAAQSFG
jgi:hypothetical protein